jgi:AcrR family transcriptional regulator
MTTWITRLTSLTRSGLCCKYSYMSTVPAPGTSPSTPVLPFPFPRSPALDRPPGMRGSRLPHDPATVAAVRLYYERTTLTHREIAEKTGVAKTSVYYWALSGGWNRPPGAAKRPLLGKNGLPGPRLKGRMLAKRLRELAEGYLDEMEKEFDTRDAEKCGVVLNFLKEANLLEQPRKPRRPLAVRARGIAERWLDQLEKEPEPIPDVLAWVLKMIEVAREEEAALHPTRPPKPVKEKRIPYSQRKLMEPSPHLPQAIERARAIAAECRGRGKRERRLRPAAAPSP